MDLEAQIPLAGSSWLSWNNLILHNCVCRVCLSVCLSACMSVCRCVGVPVYMYVYARGRSSTVWGFR